MMIICVSLFVKGQAIQKDSNSRKATFVIRSNNKPDLNNKTFSIKLIQTKGKKGQRKWTWESDEITFKRNRLGLNYMKVMEGYQTAAYTISNDTSRIGLIKFKAILHSLKATITIEGTIDGDNTEGTAIWISKMGTYEYSFAGALEK